MVRSCNIASLVLLVLNLASAKRELDEVWEDTLLNSYLEESHSQQMVKRIKAHAYAGSNNTEGDIQTAGSSDPATLPGTINFMPAFRCKDFEDNGASIRGLCNIPGTGQSYTTFGGQGGQYGNGWWPMDEMDLSAVPYTVRKNDGTDSSVVLLDQFKGVKFKKTTKTCLPNDPKFRTGSEDEAAASREKVRCDCLKTKDECLGSYIEAGRVKPGQPKSAMPTFYNAVSADTQKFIMRVCMWNENPKLGNWCSISYTWIPPVDNGATKVNDVCGGGAKGCPAMTGTGPDCPGQGQAPCEVSAVSQGI